MFTNEFLSSIRRQALRKRVWFNAIDSLERGILTIATKIIDEVKSDVLIYQLVKIIEKIESAGKSRFTKHVETYGRERLKVIYSQAEAFGDAYSDRFREDLGFMRYLIFIDFNQPIGWRIYGS